MIKLITLSVIGSFLTFSSFSAENPIPKGKPVFDELLKNKGIDKTNPIYYKFKNILNFPNFYTESSSGGDISLSEALNQCKSRWKSSPAAYHNESLTVLAEGTMEFKANDEEMKATLKEVRTYSAINPQGFDLKMEIAILNDGDKDPTKDTFEAKINGKDYLLQCLFNLERQSKNKPLKSFKRSRISSLTIKDKKYGALFTQKMTKNKFDTIQEEFYLTNRGIMSLELDSVRSMIFKNPDNPDDTFNVNMTSKVTEIK